MFIPAAIVAFFAGNLAAKFFYYLSPLSMDPESISYYIFNRTLGSGMSAFFFVITGANVAPSGRRIVAIILAIIMLIVMGFSLYGSIISRQYGYIGPLAASVVGAIIAYFTISEEESTNT